MVATRDIPLHTNQLTSSCVSYYIFFIAQVQERPQPVLETANSGTAASATTEMSRYFHPLAAAEHAVTQMVIPPTLAATGAGQRALQVPILTCLARSV